MKPILFLCLLLFPLTAFAQKREEKPSPTTNTSWEATPESLPERPENYLTIYKRNVNGLLIGNKCVEDQTSKMGFNYVLIPGEGPGSKSQAGVFLHNLGTRFLLMFKNGPFWSLRLKKKVKECRQKTGDYMG
ncbi:hypothetical protein [Nafulsella turpanensis]|uniref:hypothetical protein n=1 Tax=Nafulsella turpanensis TaxID=1265690 RepID=UPI0003477653|nr:hypothetical protein [Nafulsella turpanensis]